MTKAQLKEAEVPFGLTKADPLSVVFVVTGRTDIAIKAGTTIHNGRDTIDLYAPLPVLLDGPVPGTDYRVWVGRNGDEPRAIALAADIEADGDYVLLGGFHFAPGGNASGTSGGDDVPAINPYSCWDRNFRPACDEPGSMALIADRFWCDIYLTCVPVETDARTGRFGATIADGASLSRFNYADAQKLLAMAGKQLLGAEEFFAAAYGVTERSSADGDPKLAGLDAPRTSRHGIMQATGNMWVWGTDGHPDDPRASILGGSWFDGSSAGSRYAFLGLWPVSSDGVVGARGRSDHLTLA